MAIENLVLECSKSIMQDRALREEAERKAINEKVAKRDKFLNEYHNILNAKYNKDLQHTKLMEAARNNALSTVIKAIYITALEAGTLTDDALILAEGMVDNWIKEKGGAKKIFSECANTYVLARFRQIVEDAAEEDVAEIEKDESKIEDNKEESSDNKEDNSKNKDSDKEPKKEEDIMNDIDNNGENDNVEAAAEEIDDIADDPEVPEGEVSMDGNEENNGKVFDELEKEEDIKKAIELIRQRVADAEETFIKRNAEDKRQIDELLSKISDNIKTVEDMDDDSSTESKIAQESVRFTKRKIKDITENRPLSILEKMTRNLTSEITKNEAIREQYITENGELDTASIIEHAKVMYTFLETINTLQLEKVKEKYITKVLKEM